jgi:phage baseplate assembly protein W
MGYRTAGPLDERSVRSSLASALVDAALKNAELAQTLEAGAALMQWSARAMLDATAAPAERQA